MTPVSFCHNNPLAAGPLLNKTEISSFLVFLENKTEAYFIMFGRFKLILNNFWKHFILFKEGLQGYISVNLKKKVSHGYSKQKQTIKYLVNM